MELRYLTKERIYWSVSPLYPDRFGSPTQEIKAKDSFTVLQYRNGPEDQWQDVPIVKETIDETEGFDSKLSQDFSKLQKK